jgi:FMN-dependent oxidoreductase (nitrilotriacetate monooxygenase family)
MSRKKRQVKLGVFFLGFGFHPAAWRHPAAQAGGNPNIDYWIRLTKLAEQAKFDSVFLADFVGQAGGNARGQGRNPTGYNFEPLALMSALAAVTKNIGLVATVNTNFSDPFNVARRFASLDHLSGGRAAWNVVSSFSEGAARTFGVDKPLDHSSRYERAAEFVEVAKALWDGWDDDAFARPDRDAGIYYDARAAHPLRHRGKYFSIDGLLDGARPVQGYPVLVQAGNSDTGKDFAARIAEMVYCSAQSVETASAYYADVKGRLDKYGREPDDILITPGLSPIIGQSEQEAQDKLGELQDRVDFTGALNTFGVDLSKYSLDGPLPENLPDPENGKGRFQQFKDLARREKLTIRQLILRFSVVRGHNLVVGTPKNIADTIENWFVNKGADGFNIIPPLLPGGFEDFVKYVVPELQRRELFRTEYEGKTLRENLGLSHPGNQHARPAEELVAQAA